MGAAVSKKRLTLLSLRGPPATGEAARSVQPGWQCNAWESRVRRLKQEADQLMAEAKAGKRAMVEAIRRPAVT
jgi:hypothetical protein